MDSEALYQLIADPTLLTQDTLVGLRKTMDKYPYFQTARMLYLKNLAVLNDPCFLPELQQMSFFMQNRETLFTYIEGEKYGLCLKECKDIEGAANQFGLIDSFLSSFEIKEQSEELDISKILPSTTLSSDYIQTLSKMEYPLEGTNTKLHRQDLIDSFIDEDARRVKIGLKHDESQEITLHPHFDSDNEAVVALDESSFSETLARIYVKQKRYEKAMQIIQKLSLKYPEKNGYFADQIRFLEKLIINTKK